MLGTKIQTLRKNKGYSQEVLAEKLHVVRQTVSKWEKELSVPDADMLNQLSEIFEVPVSSLLDNKIPEIEGKVAMEELVQQLSILNEQYAERNTNRRRMYKKIGIGICIALIILFLAAVLPQWNKIWHDFGGNLYHMING